MVRKSTSWAVLIYGLFITALGYLGFYLAESRISLYVGCSLGVLLIFSSILMFNKKPFGAYAAVLLTLILTGTFAIRYSITGHGLPATLAVFSGGMLLFLLARTVRWKH